MLAVSSAFVYLAGCGTLTSAVLAFLNRYYPRKPSEAPSSFKLRSFADHALPLITVFFAGAVMYLASQNTSTVGMQGVAGPQGLTGPPGQGLDEARIQSVIDISLSRALDKLNLSRNSSLDYLKQSSCFEDFSKLLIDLQSSYDNSQRSIVTPQPAPYHLGMFPRLLPDAIQASQKKIEVCVPKVQQVLENPITDEQLDNAVENEPKESVDQQRKFRRNFWKFDQIKRSISFYKNEAKRKMDNLKEEIEK